MCPVESPVGGVFLATGLRANEVRSLTWNSFELDSPAPTVTVEAAYSKHRRRDVLPLAGDVAAALRDWRREHGRDGRVFPLPYKGAVMLKADLEAAGIDYRDHAGRHADFHALRHTFITNLARGGVPAKVAQTLARHSTISLTMDRYTHMEVLDQRRALEVLPDLTAPPGVEVVRATGTDGATGTWTEKRTRKRTQTPLKTPHQTARVCNEADGASRTADGGRTPKMASERDLGVVPPGGLEPPTSGLRIRCSAS